VALRSLHLIMRLLLVAGSTRPGSSNTRALERLRLRPTEGVEFDLYDGLRELPAFGSGKPVAWLDARA
jgi:chromate reductase